MPIPSLMRHRSIALFCQVILVLTTAAAAHAQPTFSKSFSPSTMGPGSTSTLTFMITNGGAPLTDLAFTDVLPASVTIATPASASTSCDDASLSAPAGGTTISLSGGRLGGSATCTVMVNVTSSVPGIHTNVSGNLTSSAGNSGNATADLTVAINRPGVSKSFSSSSIALGQRSTLTFTFDNTANPNMVFHLNLLDNLPTGLAVAGPANASTTCTGGTLNATPGSSVISYGLNVPGDASVAGGATCTISVDVVGTGIGQLDNTTENVTCQAVLVPGVLDVGKATDTIEVTFDPLTLIKSFTDDPVPPGGTVNLQFTIDNLDRFDAATNITFTDDLNATLPGLTAISLPATPCGPGSVLTGTTLLTLTGGNLPAEGSCTFDVPLQVPAAASGSYPNTTSTVNADVGGTPVTGAAATDLLFVEPAPLLTKSFTDDPVLSGSTVTLEFTITNTSPTSAATNIAFEDVLPIPIRTASMIPAAGFCGGATAIFIPFSNPSGTDSNPARLIVSGGSLAAGASCTFSAVLDVFVDTVSGTYPNTTGVITATVDGETVTGNPASDDLVVISGPTLLKDFTDDPVLPGDTVTLEFTLLHNANAAGDATGISFSDDLSATLAGLMAIDTPMNNICGTGSQISGTTNLTFTGGTLAPGDACTFAVTLQVPGSAAAGAHTNTTSNVAATVLGLPTVSAPGSDDLLIAGLELTKTFLNEPVLPGTTVDLQFTITNVNPASDATNITFFDDVGNTVSNMTATGLPMNNICGTGSILFGTSGDRVLNFAGGSLTVGTSCTFTVTLQVPPGTPSDTYRNSTVGFSATVEGSTVAFENAVDDLTVTNELLEISKSFTDDPASPGGTVNLEFTISNLDATQDVTAITFTDDLDATLSGLAAIGLPANNVCGAGSQISGTSLLTLTAGNLLAGTSCTFSVTLQVPAGVALGSVATNTTSTVSGDAGGIAVVGGVATDDLEIDFLDFSKAFSGLSTAGGTPTLTFTIENLSATSSVSAITFTDDLDAVLSGLVATGLPMNDVCGNGSQISGTSFLSLTAGSLMPGGTCTIIVPLQVPAAATPGSYLNTSSELFLAGIPSSAPATDTLGIEPAPLFSKAFAPNAIGLGGVSTLTFTIDNSASALAAGSLDFTDNLPAGLTVAAVPNATTTCIGGTLTATAGSGVITYTGGTVSAGASCTVQVDVTAGATGSLVNTSGDLTSTSGNSGTASDTLVVNPQPVFTKSFAPDPILVGGVSTLTFTIDNSASTVDTTGLDFTDNLPAAIIVATPANASTTCTGGTLTAADGSGVITYTGGAVSAGTSCTVQADVTSSTPGTHTNVSGALTSSLGSSGTATDTLTVNPPPAFSKSFAPNPIIAGQTSTLTFTIDNGISTVDATGLDFTDNLPAGVIVATPGNAATTCTGGALTAADGSGVITYTGGTVGAGASCTVQVDVTSVSSGMHLNVSGDLTSSLGNSGTATDTLTVNPAAPAFSKAFAPDLIVVGDVSTLTLTIDNSANNVAVGNLAFTDNLPAAALIATPANAATTCTGGTLTATAGTGTITYSGGTVGAAATCTVSVDVTSSTAGAHVNTTGDLTSDAGSSGTASATLTVVEELMVSKTFITNPVLQGGLIDLEYTLTNPSATIALSDIAFTDDLDAVVSGLAAITTPATDVCGAGSQLTGSSVLSLSGGNLAPGTSCTFQATLQVPVDAPLGIFPSTTSTVTAMAGGVSITAAAATADLEIVFLEFTKAFGDTSVVGGGTTLLTFTIANPDPNNSAADLAFSDDLDAVLPGLMAVDVPQNDVCGAGSLLDGASLLTLSGGSVAGGGSCTFAVTLQVPATAPTGEITNTTSPLTASVGGAPVAGDPATVAVAVLQVLGNLLAIPTLDTWGLLLLTLALLFFAVRKLRFAPARK